MKRITRLLYLFFKMLKKDFKVYMLFLLLFVFLFLLLFSIDTTVQFPDPSGGWNKFFKASLLISESGLEKIFGQQEVKNTKNPFSISYFLNFFNLGIFILLISIYSFVFWQINYTNEIKKNKFNYD